MPLTTRLALSNSHLVAVHLWLAIAKAVSRCPRRLMLFDARTVGGVKQLRSFERHREWTDVTPYKLTVGIGFHTRTLPALLPLVSVIAFPRSAVRRSARMWLIRSSWVARRRRRLLSAQYWARLLRKVLGWYQYHPILANIGQYPVPQYRYRSNPCVHA